MRSEIRVFARAGYKSSKGLILPRSEFKFFTDMKDPRIDPVKAEHIMKEAEEYLLEDLTVIPLSLYRDKFLTGSRTNYESVHHHRRTMLFYMLLAEMYEDKGRFVEKIADVAWAIMEETSWVIPAHTGNSLMRPGTDVPEVFDEKNVPGLDLYAANCGALLAMVRHYLKDKLDAISPYICQRIDHLVYLRTVRPYIVGHYWWMTAAHNWPTGITMNVLIAMAATVEDMALRERTVDKAFWVLDNFTSGMPEDGCCDEGPAYWGAGAGAVFNALLLFNDLSAGKINLFGDEMVRNLCSYISKANIHENYFVNFADCSGRFSTNGNMIEDMGKWLGSPELETFGRRAAYNKTGGSYFFGATYRAMRDAMTPVITEAEPVKAKKSVWLEGGKVAIFRESEDTSKGLFIATKGGTNHEPGNHNDMGALIIFSNGAPIAVDPGIGSYNNEYFNAKYRYLRWFTNSNAHSCPEINGYQQIAAGSGPSKDEVCDVEGRQVSMDIAAAYPKDAGLVSLVRSCKLEDGRITVSDSVKLESEGEYVFHLNMVNEPKLIEDGRIDIGEGRVLEYNKNDLTFSYDRVENKCLPYDDLNIQSKWGVECLWDLKLTVKAQEYVNTVTIS